MDIINNKDFNLIYKYYLEDFPLCERKTKKKVEGMLLSGKYQLFLAKNNVLQGYILAYQDNLDSDFLWIDYLAIIKSERGKGIGTAFLKTLMDKFKYIILEVEYSDGIEGSITYKREKFYRNLGARLIEIPYELPTADGSMGMNLFVLSKYEYPDKMHLKEFIVKAVSFIHSDYLHTNDVINKYIDFLKK